LLKNLPFDKLGVNRGGPEDVEHFPFVLSPELVEGSKHDHLLFSVSC
jgi:hypothetical protein